MPEQLTESDVRESLSAHVVDRGAAIRARYGPEIGWQELLAILEDRVCVRYPCEIVFDGAPLLPGECAHPVARSERPEGGFDVYVHPHFAGRPSVVPYLVLYQLVVVNYGDFASDEDAEAFGAAAFGLPRDAYYQLLCELADDLYSSEVLCSRSCGRGG